MATSKKIADVAELKARLEACEIAIATRYTGITVEQVTDLRRKLRDVGVEYKVYKNTLARRALKELDIEAAADYMDGATAWVFSSDPVAPAKVLKEFGKKVKKVSMAGGVLSGKPIDAAQLDALASLPSREQLLAQVVGTIAAPLRNMVGTLTALPRNLVNVLDQVQKKKTEEEAAA